MGYRVCIIHGSPIIQYGLADLLRRFFKSEVRFFFNIDDLTLPADEINTKTLLFVEDQNGAVVGAQNLIQDGAEIILFKIKMFEDVSDGNNWQNSIFVYNSPDQICEKVKSALDNEKTIHDKTEELSNREIDVLKLVALGFSNKEIADRLFISTHTVMSHRKNMTEKLGIKSISGLTVYAIIQNYIDTTNLDIKDLI